MIILKLRIVTRQFIYLTFPRTGCNFCRTVIKELYHKRHNENKLLKYSSINNSYEEILTHHYFEGKENHHTSYSQIPEKIIVSNIRNPISRFESMYKLKWWNSVNAFDDTDFKNIYNNYPNVSIEDYTDLLDKSFQQHLNKISFNKNIKIGPQTLEFINFFFKNPPEVLKNISLSYIENIVDATMFLMDVLIINLRFKMSKISKYFPLKKKRAYMVPSRARLD